jgi:type II secretory pathway pseudopilin PulG
MNNKGFILLEILLALVILGAVIVPAIHGIAGYLRAVSSSNRTLLAAAYAQQMLTQVTLNQISESTMDGRFASTDEFSWKATKIPVSDIEFQYTANIVWKERGREQTLPLTTIRTELSL